MATLSPEGNLVQVTMGWKARYGKYRVVSGVSLGEIIFEHFTPIFSWKVVH